jgi:hypothetical protein
MLSYLKKLDQDKTGSNWYHGSLIHNNCQIIEAFTPPFESND